MRTSTARVSLALAVSVVAASIVGCGGDNGDGESGAPVRTYRVRGEVVTLAADNGGELRVAHEAIDDFMAADGTIVGMDSMTMSFVVADGVDSGLAVGDRIEFDLRVDWSSSALATVTRIEPLPADTELVYGVARPPSDGSSSDGGLDE